MKVDTLDEQLEAVLFQDRFITNLAFLAVMLSGAGLCAMLFYAIARRTREIVVRVARHARRSDDGAEMRPTYLVHVLGFELGFG
jgi:hypothetical protein